MSNVLNVCVQKFAQKLVNADRASLFLLDNHTHELYARIFDVGTEQRQDKSNREIRLAFGAEVIVTPNLVARGNVDTVLLICVLFLTKRPVQQKMSTSMVLLNLVLSRVKNIFYQTPMRIFEKDGLHCLKQ